MKVLLINGSPHEFGCTYTALKEVANKLNEEDIQTEIYFLGNKPIQSCTACGSCRNTGKCIFNDQVNEVIAKAQEIDGLIVGTPVHYAAASGMVTAFMDRLFYASNAFSYKPGAAVAVARRAGTVSAFDQLNKYFTINNMPVVSSQYWNMAFGNTPEEILKDEEGMQIMRTLGLNMAWLLKSIAEGKKAGLQYPSVEKKARTNFIR